MPTNGQSYDYFVCRGQQSGLRDLPYLPTVPVERTVERADGSLLLPAEFIDRVQGIVPDALNDHQESARQLHETLMKQLKKIAVQEERLIDLAADGSVPHARIRVRLNKLAVDRKGCRRAASPDKRGAGGRCGTAADVAQTEP